MIKYGAEDPYDLILTDKIFEFSGHGSSNIKSIKSYADYSNQIAVPANGQVVANLYGNLVTLRVPFRIEIKVVGKSTDTKTITGHVNAKIYHPAMDWRGPHHAVLLN